MSWLLDDQLPLYDWSNSSYTTEPVATLLSPAVTYMNYSPSTLMTSHKGGILPQLNCHGAPVSTTKGWTPIAADGLTRSNFGRSILTQAVGRNIELDSEISNQTVSLNHT